MSSSATGLYVHLPWCVSKCPYCDFNSHALTGDVPHERYVAALRRDLDLQAAWFNGRSITSIFIGGGTPSLFPGSAIRELLEHIERTLEIAADVEVTMEANPGSVERDHLAHYLDAGVNRLSIGVQSFQDRYLARLERQHSAAEAKLAVEEARDVGFTRVNVDLMYGLPEQSLEDACTDIDMALDLDPGHVSHYQLTLEPNTRFAAVPPALPPADAVADMGDAGREQMHHAGYKNYEISANARAGHECHHNLNYWRFGDYGAIGAGAHGKLTFDQKVYRYRQKANPQAYLAAMQSGQHAALEAVTEGNAIFEYFLNRTRLAESFTIAPLELLATNRLAEIDRQVSHAVELGLVEARGSGWAREIRPTMRGQLYLNDLQALFLP